MLNHPWLSKNRTFILIVSILIGLISAYFNADLMMVPFFGIIIFFIPVMLKLRESKSAYYVQICNFFVTCISLIGALFTYKFFEEVVSGNKILDEAFRDLKGELVLFSVIFGFLFLVALPFGFLWKKVLNLNRVHLQILINQFSLPVLASGFLILSTYIYFTGQSSSSNDGIHWYHLLVLPTILLLPWLFHMAGLFKMAKEKGITISHFLYVYEVSRLESPKRFWELQAYSRKTGIWVILIPLSLLFLYQIFFK